MYGCFDFPNSPVGGFSLPFVPPLSSRSWFVTPTDDGGSLFFLNFFGFPAPDGERFCPGLASVIALV